MKYLFVTYCFGSYEGQTLIGVYKRGLRVAIELVRRGHEIEFFCTGRQVYHDELTELAEKSMTFVDIPFAVTAFEEAIENRNRFIAAIEEISPDIIVIGEAPLAGPLLEATLCGVELEIPIVILDNAYNPLFVEYFCKFIGSMADAIILAGPSSMHSPTPPEYLCQLPPFIDSAPEITKKFIRDTVQLRGEKLITVLAYDQKVESVGLSLIKALDGVNVDLVFCARDPEDCRSKLAAYSKALQERAHVIPQPREELLMGLLEISDLSVVKYGFMQVSECLALRTPVIVVYHEGPTWLDSLPEIAKQFTWVTDVTEIDIATLAAAQRFLGISPSEMTAVHNGEFNAASRAADFLERVNTSPRGGTTTEAANFGFTKARIQKALAVRFPDNQLDLHAWRFSRLRVTPQYDLYNIIVKLSVDRKIRFERLWARAYNSEELAKQGCEEAKGGENGRGFLHYVDSARFVLEDDLGEAELPELNP